jgi:LPXTG-site transpeptidase (sortase) family protein
VIEKIDVNVPIVWDVSINEKDQYLTALKTGVAHASGTNRPSERNGNSYLFAHSTLNPLEIEKYAASFTLLHRLEVGDKISIFNNNTRYDYIVQWKEVVNGFNTEPLTRQPDYPMLTLQTCDPPGIPLNRLIITAKLVSHYEIEY